MSPRLGWVALVVAAACAPTQPKFPSPPPCAPIPPQRPGLPADVVWGYADLHAHPAIERAFAGKLIWGAAIDDAPVDGNLLPRILSCPVETHTQPGTGPIDRAVGQQIFPAVANVASFAHGPTGTAWPNARDVIHQQMNVASIRRAYEGGLRLMFASTTDDQVVAALLSGPNFVDGFVPKPSADYDSARAQLELITTIARTNSSWMGIARTPAEARALIAAGKLALVLSIEMNGPRASEVDRLVQDFGVRHVFPIHLIDNGVGGSAVNSSLFNAATAAVSALYRKDGLPMQYMDVAASADFPPALDRPQSLVTLAMAPVYVGLEEVPYSAYARLCYEPLAACNRKDAAPTTFVQYGQENLRGLCTTAEQCRAGDRPGATVIRQWMDDRLMLDVSHMGARSVRETVALDTDFPLIASHGDVVRLCTGSPTQPPCTDSVTQPMTERALEAEVARELVRRDGVLGLGTGLGNFDTRPLLVARGGPLFTLSRAAERTVGCVAPPDAGGCTAVAQVDSADAGAAIDTLQVEAIGSVSSHVGNAQPFVRVELRDPVDADQFQRRVVSAPLDCTDTRCTATVALGSKEAPTPPDPDACLPLRCTDKGTCGTAPYTVDDVEQVTVEWLYLECDAQCQAEAGADVVARQCASTWASKKGVAPSWSIDALTVSAGLGAATAPIARWGDEGGELLAVLGGARGSFVAYARGDRPSVHPRVQASGHLIQVTMTAGASGKLPGATAQQVGTNACVALRHREGGVCQPARPIPLGQGECPAEDGWVSINQRGEWATGGTLYTFLRFPGDPATLCGVDFSLLDWDPAAGPFAIDAITVAAAEDPVGHWVRRYAEVARHVADGRLGTIAFGTDFNGLNGVIDLSELPAPALSAPSACPGPLGPLRFRERDGTPGDPVLIEQRGLATYGLLADFLGVVAAYPGCGEDVRSSLMLSAEATLRAWERIVDPTAPARPKLPQAAFACGRAPGVPP